MSPSFSNKSLTSKRCLSEVLCGISSRFQLLSPTEGQVAHALLTRSPLSHNLKQASSCASFDLHVLGMPPAFILSQDQTLNKCYLNRRFRRIKIDSLKTLICFKINLKIEFFFIVAVPNDFKRALLFLVLKSFVSFSYIV